MKELLGIKYLLINSEVLHDSDGKCTLDVMIDKSTRFIPRVGMVMSGFCDSNAPWLVSAVMIYPLSATVLLCQWNLYRPEKTELYVGIDNFMIGVLKEDLILRPVMPNKMAERGGFAWGYNGWGPNNLGRVLLREATGLDTESKGISQNTANNFEEAFIQPLTQNTPFVIQGRDIRLWAKKNLSSYKPSLN